MVGVWEVCPLNSLSENNVRNFPLEMACALRYSERIVIDAPDLHLVPGSARVKDALDYTIPPAPPILRSLFNLVPADSFIQSFIL